MSVEKETVQNLRQDYKSASLSKKDVNPDPFKQFDKWFKEALDADLMEPNAMTLATVAENGKPSARIVLLKGFSSDGFVFYSNYLSKKGREIDANPNVSIVFYWDVLERQVRIEGKISKLSENDSLEYFKTRPIKSQLGAVVSQQSSIITSRDVLETEMAQLEEKYNNQEVPKPDHWGGYIIKPNYFEFWQGRRSRLHDRIIYEKTASKSWEINRLAP